MNIGTIDLTGDEQQLISQIDFNPDPIRMPEHHKVVDQGERCVLLMKGLIDRGAIPENRIKYFTDPAYNVGGYGKSRKQIFEGNDTRGLEIYKHPHFLKYLRYFVYGADLPDQIKRQFKLDVEACHGVSGSDAIDLGKKARSQAREWGLERKSAAEEFYKLALDCDIYHSWAETIRSAVLQMKAR